jgi:5-methylcytosine-specific restriction endonuclease McrA
MGAQKVQDRGKFRQLAAQIAMLYFTKHSKDLFCDTKAEKIDDFYYENLGFDSNSSDAKRLFEILDKLTELLRNQKRSKIIGHEAIHLVLLVDSLIGDYTRSWEETFASAFDNFRHQFALGKKTRDDPSPSEYWLRYGVHTRVNSDRGDVIQRRHEFFSVKMRDVLNPQLKDSQRLYGTLERELIYYRDKKRCAVCGVEVAWPDLEIHHIEEHGKGGMTTLENGVLVHKDCHPKGAKAVEFAKRWAEKRNRS